MFSYNLFKFRNIRPSDVEVQIVEHQHTRSSAEIARRVSKVSIAPVSETAARSEYDRLGGELLDQLVNESRLPHRRSSDKGNSSAKQTFPMNQRRNLIGCPGLESGWVLESAESSR